MKVESAFLQVALSNAIFSMVKCQYRAIKFFCVIVAGSIGSFLVWYVILHTQYYEGAYRRNVEICFQQRTSGEYFIFAHLGMRPRNSETVLQIYVLYIQYHQL